MADNEAQGTQAADQQATDAAAEAAKAEAATPPKTYSQEEVDRIASRVKKNASYRAKKEVEAYYRGLQQGAQPPPKQEPVKEPEAPKEPQRGDFEDYEAFLTARAEFKAERKVEERFAKERETQTQTQSQTEKDKLRQNFVKQAEALSAEVEDFEDAMDTQVRMPDSMVQAILETDIPARVAYYLAKHPQDAERISELSASKQAIAIGRIEAKVAAELEAKKANGKGGDKADDGDGGEEDGEEAGAGKAAGIAAAAAAKAASATAASGLPATGAGAPNTAQASKAPAPIKPVGGKSSVGDQMPDPKSDPSGWYKWRQNQVAKQTRAAQKSQA